jgi:hypothetical protein
MRVFHFVRADYGLENIQHRRHKIAILSEVNDPFEFISMDTSNKTLRQSIQFLRANMDHSFGMLCFSRRSDNPVQWSHYADHHRGICLGFDVPDQLLTRISYTAKRLVADADRLIAGHQMDQAIIDRLLSTKYSHWRYESEVRQLVPLQTSIVDSGRYFAPYSENLALRQVIVGARSTVTRTELGDALGELAKSVQTHKSRLAFRTFRVVRQRAESLWT